MPACTATNRSSEDPACSRIILRFLKTLCASSVTVPSMRSPVSGSIATTPDTNTKSPARVAQHCGQPYCAVISSPGVGGGTMWRVSAMCFSPSGFWNHAAGFAVTRPPAKQAGVDPVGDGGEHHHQKHHDQDHRDRARRVVFRRIEIQPVVEPLGWHQALAGDDADEGERQAHLQPCQDPGRGMRHHHFGEDLPLARALYTGDVAKRLVDAAN